MADNIEVLGVLKLQPDQRSIDEMAAAIQSKLATVTSNPSVGLSGASGGTGAAGTTGTTPAPETKPVPPQTAPKTDTGKTIGDAVERALSRSRFGQAVDRFRGISESIGRVLNRAGQATRTVTGIAGRAAAATGSARAAGGAAEAVGARGAAGAGASIGGLIVGGSVAAGIGLVAAVNRIGKNNIQQLLADADVSPAGARLALMREITRRENALNRSNISGDSTIKLQENLSELEKLWTTATAAIADKVFNPLMTDVSGAILKALEKAGLYSPQNPTDVNINTRMFYQRAMAEGYRSPPPIPGMVQIRP